jgi:CrcB protein
MKKLAPYCVIAAGSVIGSLLRWGAGTAFSAWLGPGFPWGTLFVNITGSLAIGWFAALAAARANGPARPLARLFVMTGVCGGYTTFSAFTLETLRFLHAGAAGAALAYIGATMVISLAAVWLGEMLGARRG